MTEAEKAYQYFVIAVPESEEQAKAYFWARKALQSTLTPPTEWVSVEERLPEGNGEYIVTACDEGCHAGEGIWYDTVVVFAEYYDGCWTWNDGTEYDLTDIVTHWMPLPAPPGKDNNVPTKAQNEPLTIEQLRQMDGEPVWGKSLITDKPGEWFIVRVVEMSKAWFIACAGASQGFGDKDTYGITWLAYREEYIME